MVIGKKIGFQRQSIRLPPWSAREKRFRPKKNLEPLGPGRLAQHQNSAAAPTMETRVPATARPDTRSLKTRPGGVHQFGAYALAGQGEEHRVRGPQAGGEQGSGFAKIGHAGLRDGRTSVRTIVYPAWSAAPRPLSWTSVWKKT
jgi:hypothetical protein